MDTEKPIIKNSSDSPYVKPELTMVLTAYINGEYLPFGSCISIGHGLVLTSAHVIEEFNVKAGGAFMLSHGQEPLFPVYTIQFCEAGHANHRMWIVRSLFIIGAEDGVENSDLMVLRIEPLPDSSECYRFPKVSIDLSPPAVSSRVEALGYPGTHAVKQGSTFKFKANLLEVNGLVEEVHLDKRDTSRLNYPCFQTNFHIEGGMSGGPVFNDRGSLCGINIQPLEKKCDIPDTSYASLLWPFIFHEEIYALIEKKATSNQWNGTFRRSYE